MTYASTLFSYPSATNGVELILHSTMLMKSEIV